MKKIIRLIFGCILCLNATAQHKVLISGNITDARTKEALPFVSVSLKKQLIGTVSNEVGNFDLYIPEGLENDSLQINGIGYIQQTIALNKIQQMPINIRLRASAVQLKEVEVRPKPPEYYIRLAVLKIKDNYPTSPFINDAYYREKVLENKNFLKCDEGIFRTYCPNYLDTTKNQHQLLLYRQEKNVQEVKFMSKEREEAEKKQKKREEKAAKKGKPAPKKENDNFELDLASSFGGPETVFKADFFPHPDRFLDTLEFKHYDYTFAQSSSYNNSELMVIEFKTNKKVDHIRESGRIYIDVVSHAFVKIECAGDFVIPIAIKPILFFAGFGIENPTFDSAEGFQQAQGKWYPKKIHSYIDLQITKRRMFSANDNSDFEIETIYTVNKLQIDNISPIPVEKRFKSNKPMEEQVHNDDNITWEGINIIKK